jgi:hypothetical protein
MFKAVGTGASRGHGWKTFGVAGALFGSVGGFAHSARAQAPPSAQFGVEGAPPALPEPPPPQQSAPPSYAPYSGPPAYGQPAPMPAAQPAWNAPFQPSPASRPPDAAPAVPPAPPDWSLGAGVGLGVSALGGLSGVQALQSPPTPALRLSFEHRVGDSTWLILNAVALTSASNEPIESINGNSGGLGAFGTPTRTTLAVRDSRVSALLGVRQVMVHAVVDLSLYGAVFASYESFSGDDLRSGEVVQQTPGSNADTFGIVGGLAVERELIPNLAVRLTADLVQANTTKTNVASSDGLGNVTTTKFVGNTVGLILSPSLDLQFYF